ncbi:MAG: CCA tRNA nucleotidyltransferase [Paracoccaceae bacterium]
MQLDAPWLTRPATQAVCAALTDAGFQALFVGGCVRNALINVPVDDIDIATDATPDRVIELAENAGLRAVPTGIDHGTITVVSDHIPHEITTFRRDVETTGRHAVVAFSGDVMDDAKRRDFTMNALYCDPAGRVIDPLNGLPDLQARRVRFIEDANQRIAEDYLRILRFFRFHAWYGDAAQGLDAEGLAAVATHTDGLQQLSRERVWSELCKLLTALDPAPSVAAMRAAGVLACILNGADDTGLAPLIHLEGLTDTRPDPIRRMAVLGGNPDALRLSKVQSRQLEHLRDGMGSIQQPHELGYRLGAAMARDILLLRAAQMGQMMDPAALDMAQQGANARFPVAAADLMPAYTGAALGAKLSALEQAWITSHFTLTKTELLTQI